MLDSVLFGLRILAPRPSKDSEEVKETAAKSKVQSSNTENGVSKQPSNGEAERNVLENTFEPEGPANGSTADTSKDKITINLCLRSYKRQ